MAVANICMPCAMPFPRDVKQFVIFDIASSRVLFDFSNASSMSFFIIRSSFAVDIRNWSL